MYMQVHPTIPRFSTQYIKRASCKHSQVEQRMNAPSSIWRGIAQHLRPNALVYVRLAEICKGARTVFESNYLWRKLIPIDTSGTYYEAFCIEVEKMDPAQRQLLFELWARLENDFLWQGNVESKAGIFHADAGIISDNLVLSIPFAIFMALCERSLLRIQRQDYNLRDLPAWENREFTLKAVSLYGPLLAFVNCTDDCEIVRAAVNSPVVPHLRLVSDRLRAQKSIVIPIVSARDCVALAAPALWSDREVVEAAVGHSWRAFTFASPELRNSFKTAMMAVSNCGRALEAASSRIKANPLIVHAAVTNYGKALEFASESIKNNKEIVLTAVENDGMALEFANIKFTDDEAVVLLAVRNNGHALKFASARLRGDEDIVLAAVQQRGSSFKYASRGLRRDDEFVERAVLLNARAIEFASPTIQSKHRKRKAMERDSPEAEEQGSL